MANNPVRQYIGARYVPLFADPAEWNNTRAYESLTIVIHQGNSYTSRQYVPIGIDITNTDYWALTGNYNAQVEAYRQEAQRALLLAQTNKNDIADIDTILNILHANSTNDATDLYKRIVQNYSVLDANVDNTGATYINTQFATINQTLHKTIFFPEGTYKINAPLIFKGDVSIIFDKNAKITTDTSIDNMIIINKVSDAEGYSKNGTLIFGGYFDGNNNATNAILNHMNNVYIAYTKIYNTIKTAITSDGWQTHFVNCTATKDTNTTGMTTAYTCAEDSTFIGCNAHGWGTGYEITAGKNLTRFIGCQTWKGVNNKNIKKTIGFNLHNSAAIITNCYIDRHAIGVNQDDLYNSNSLVINGYMSNMSSLSTESGDDLIAIHANPATTEINGMIILGDPTAKIHVYPNFEMIKQESPNWLPKYKFLAGETRRVSQNEITYMQAEINPNTPLSKIEKLYRITYTESVDSYIILAQGMLANINGTATINFKILNNGLDVTLKATITNRQITDLQPTINHIYAESWKNWIQFGYNETGIYMKTTAAFGTHKFTASISCDGINYGLCAETTNETTVHTDTPPEDITWKTITN
nr:MAG TPA: N terminal extension of bacteriophage endosialidase [Bacteriophage sp.]